MSLLPHTYVSSSALTRSGKNPPNHDPPPKSTSHLCFLRHHSCWSSSRVGRLKSLWNWWGKGFSRWFFTRVSLCHSLNLLHSLLPEYQEPASTTRLSWMCSKEVLEDIFGCQHGNTFSEGLWTPLTRISFLVSWKSDGMKLRRCMEHSLSSMSGSLKTKWQQ